MMTNDELKQHVLDILKDGFLMSLGTIDEGGVWVADVIYVHDNKFNLYWISLPNVRHSKAIDENNKIACTITASWQTKNERALQVEGVVEKIGGPMFELEKKLEERRGLEIPQSPGQILEKGHVWYVLKPTKMELLHSELFGYEKREVSI